MSKDLVNDIKKMHTKFGVTDAMAKMSKKNRAEFLKFRIAFLEEELAELKENSDKPEEVVDALIDLTVVAITTLDALGVDTNQAWNVVQKANMAKEPGVNPSRPNPLGLPDMVKPEGWVAPSHEGNHGNIVGFTPTKDTQPETVTVSVTDEPSTVTAPVKSKWQTANTIADVIAYTCTGILIATNLGPIISIFR